MPIVDSILERFKKQPDPNAPPITGKLRRSDGFDSAPAEVDREMTGMKPPADANDEQVRSIQMPSVEQFMHADRGNDFSLLGATHEGVPVHRGFSPQAAQQGPSRAPSQALDQLEQKIDILTDKVDIVQQQVKMIWDTLKSWRSS